ncbi:MAG TPA: PTS sugar transporter subunit IIA [Spirochaetia bacterium]|nr:PTS sugar transporter subunit IIA [Spirochaetia bacterium]
MGLSLQELFIPARIKCRLEAEDKAEVFEELVDHLVIQFGLNSRDEILEAIKRREEKMSTGIKRGIAIPHAKTTFTRGVIGVLGISGRGIDYESLDGEPVHMLFLLVSSEEDAGTHLAVLKKIAMLVENPDFYRETIAAGDPEKVHKIIRKYEEILDSRET